MTNIRQGSVLVRKVQVRVGYIGAGVGRAGVGRAMERSTRQSDVQCTCMDK